jgi:hypothetical protein
LRTRATRRLTLIACGASAVLAATGCDPMRLGRPTPALGLERILPLEVERLLGPAAGGAVLDIGPPDSWRGAWVGFPTVLFDGTLYRMWFTGVARARADESPYLYRSAIGLATSPDGQHWTVENGGEPVFAAGPAGAFDSHSVGHPFVMWRGGRYHLWYAGADGSQGPNSVRIERLGLATSIDGMRWHRENGGRPVLDVGEPGSPDTIQVAGPAIAEVGDRLWMWYGAYDGEHTIVMAMSHDGLTWQKAGDGRPVSGLRLAAGTGELGPSVYYDGRSFVMLYSSNVDGEWRLYGATSVDGLSWSRMGDAAVLPASAPPAFDSAGPGRNRAVHPSQWIFSEGRLRVWYMGEDARGFQRIGLLGVLVRPAAGSATPSTRAGGR